MDKYSKWIIGIGIIMIAAAFVLHQASLNGSETHNLSDRITNLIMKIIYRLRGRNERSFSQISLIVRKLAHFLEYFVYTSLTLGITRYLTKSWWISLLLTMCLVIPVPYIDEVFIQKQIEGREAQVLDMLIDYAAIGVSLLTGMWYVLIQSISLK